MMKCHATTILAIKEGDCVVMIGDGQVSLGNTVMKSTARKVRRLSKGNIITGFAGSTADAFALFEKLEKKLEKHPNQLTRACTELAKEWRGDDHLRKLEAMMLVADRSTLLILSGTGDVIEPEKDIAAIGSGGVYALSAARALMRSRKEGMSIEDVALESMKIAAEICVYTNDNFVVEKLG